MTLRHVMLRAADLVALAVILLGLFYTLEAVRGWLRDPQDWLIVSHVSVADHITGEDPQVTYDREVVRPFRARWYAKAHRLDDAMARACEGAGEHDYDPGEYPGAVTLSWYVGRPCDLAPGRYILRTRWVLENGLIFRHSTAPFTVHPSP